MVRRNLSRPALLALLAAVGAAQNRAHAVVTPSLWGNTGNDWYNNLNWVGGTPGASSPTILPASPLHLIPDIGTGTASAQGLSIDNTLGSYSISPTLINGAALGTLVLGNGSFAQTGGGTTNLNL